MKIIKAFCILTTFCLLLVSISACKPASTGSEASGVSSDEASNVDGTTGSHSEDSQNPDITNPSGSAGTSPAGTNGNGNSSQNPQSSTGSSGSSGSAESMPYFNVRNYGAKGNGTTDDAPAIKKAIDAAQKANGGIVYLPSGMYRMNSGVDVPMGVSLRGEPASTLKKWRKVSNLGTGTLPLESAGGDWLNTSNYAGTWIVVNHGEGNVDAHATFELQGNASIYNLGFVHANTAPVVSKITVYPPAIAIKNVKSNPYTRDGMTIEDIVLLNAYVGIGVHAGNGKLLDHQNGQEADLYSMGRMRVHNVTGGCVYRGIVMKGLLDTIDLQNIRFGYTNLEKTYAKQRANECADMEWYRADGTNATNLFSFGAKYGILTTPGFISGSTSMRLSKAELYGQYPLYLSASGQYEIEDCTFTAINFNKLCTGDTYQVMTVIQDETSVHQPFYAFNRLTLVNGVKSTSATDISLYLVTKRSSATAMVMLSNLIFTGWSPDKKDPVIYYETASRQYGGFASLYNCSFKDGSTAGKLYEIANVPSGGLQFNGCTIPSSLISNSTNANNAVWFN